MMLFASHPCRSGGRLFARHLQAMLVVLAGCRNPGSKAAPPAAEAGAAPATATTSPSESAARPDGSSPPIAGPKAQEDAGVDAAPDGTAAMDKATFERLTFRQVVVGHLVFPAERLTWTLYRSATRTRLQLICQQGPRGPGREVSLTGAENDEAQWGAPVVTEYVGARVDERSRSLRLSASSGPVGATGCETVPDALVLSCRREQVPVLRAGAALIPGTSDASGRISPPRWQPAQREMITALVCDVSSEGDTDGIRRRFLLRLWRDWPLAFVAAKNGAPGIEWAHENSDMRVQAGGYRWMPVPH